MNKTEQKQLNRIVLEHTEDAEAQFREYIAPIWNGTDLRNASLVERSVSATVVAMSDFAQNRVQRLLSRIAAVTATEGSFAIAEDAISVIIEQLWDELASLLEAVCRDGAPASTFGRGASEFMKMRRQFFVNVAAEKARFLGGTTVVTEDAQVGANDKKNPGGRPRSDHWDQMWASIAVQLFSGELRPVRQADIKQAMLDWFAREQIDVSDSSVIKRARMLFHELESSE